MHAALTIGIPSYSDPRVWDVLFHLRRDARMHNAVGKFKTLVVENNPNSVQGEINAKTAKGFGAKFVAMADPVGTAPPRNRIFDEADTDWVLVIDSHVYLDFDVLPKLLAFCTSDNRSLDLHYGPLLNSTQIRADGSPSIQWTHWTDGVGGDGMYGQSATNPAAVDPSLEPFEIVHSGCGLFLARRDYWLGFHPEFRGFGVEGYLGPKYRRAGRKVWCQPWLKWGHWFRDKRLAPEFPASFKDRTRNLVLTWQELGRPKLSTIKAHHVEKPGRTTLKQWVEILEELRIDESAAFAAEKSPPEEKPAPKTPTDEDYLASFPCRFRKRKSGSILCNIGCASNQSRSHSIYDCSKLGVVTLSRVRSDLASCAFCEKREAPAEAPPVAHEARSAPKTVQRPLEAPKAAETTPNPPNQTIRMTRVVHGRAKREPLVIVGRGDLGSVRMRGIDVAARIGVPFVDFRSQPIPKARSILLVKHWPEDPGVVRAACDQLIHDPMDLFWQAPDAPAVEYWRGAIEILRPDVMLATSPACADLMMEAGAKSVTVAPHHADERIGTDWHNPSGPVVYAGLREFLGDQEETIRDACKALGREFIVSHGGDCWKALEGAALALAVRCGRSATKLNRYCKPQIKLANAARAGIPVLATDDPAVTSLCPLTTITTGNWREDIERALESAPPVHPWNLDTHCELVRGLIIPGSAVRSASAALG